MQNFILGLEKFHAEILLSMRKLSLSLHYMNRVHKLFAGFIKHVLKKKNTDLVA